MTSINTRGESIGPRRISSRWRSFPKALRTSRPSLFMFGGIPVQGVDTGDQLRQGAGLAQEGIKPWRRFLG